jgi:hypothetical protein
MRLSGQAKFRVAVKSEFFNSIGENLPLTLCKRERPLGG